MNMSINQQFYVVIEKSLFDPINNEKIIGICKSYYDAETYLTSSRRIVGPVPLLQHNTVYPQIGSSHFASEDFAENMQIDKPNIYDNKPYVRIPTFHPDEIINKYKHSPYSNSTSNPYFHQ